MHEQRTYTMTLSWSEEHGVSIGQGEALAGVAGTGSTYEEALASTLEAIRWWQEMSTRQANPSNVQPDTEAR